jgi:hypothetical protein
MVQNVISAVVASRPNIPIKTQKERKKHSSQRFWKSYIIGIRIGCTAAKTSGVGQRSTGGPGIAAGTHLKLCILVLYFVS